jgi:hypothetical protein
VGVIVLVGDEVIAWVATNVGMAVEMGVLSRGVDGSDIALDGVFVRRASRVEATIVPAKAWSMPGVETGRTGKLQAARIAAMNVIIRICWCVFIPVP